MNTVFFKTVDLAYKEGMYYVHVLVLGQFATISQKCLMERSKAVVFFKMRGMEGFGRSSHFFIMLICFNIINQYFILINQFRNNLK